MLFSVLLLVSQTFNVWGCVTLLDKRNSVLNHTVTLHSSHIFAFRTYNMSVCVCLLHLLQCYFTPQPLMCSVREQQHGSLTCHTVAGHCVMIRVCWRHSESTGVIKWCIGPASLPQICLRLWHRLSQAYVYSHFIYFFYFSADFHFTGFTYTDLA